MVEVPGNGTGINDEAILRRSFRWSSLHEPNQITFEKSVAVIKQDANWPELRCSGKVGQISGGVTLILGSGRTWIHTLNKEFL